MGVEGGATKSTAILADEKSKIVGQRRGRALNYHYLGKTGVKKNLAGLIRPLIKKAKAGDLYAVFGFAGLDAPQDALAYEAIVRSVLPKNSVFEVVNDSKIALEVRCPEDKDRILVIAGTGSNVYGERRSKSTRSIGWGFLLGDEASGYDFGLKALKAAMRSFDGRGKKTVLEKFVLQKIGVQTMLDAVPKIYEKVSEKKRNVKHYVASFAPLVDRAARQKDEAALAIQREAVDELAKGVSAVAQKLRLQEKKFCLGLMGSVWNMRGLRERFQKEVTKRYPRVCFSENQDEGAWGAILLAKKL